MTLRDQSSIKMGTNLKKRNYFLNIYNILRQSGKIYNHIFQEQIFFFRKLCSKNKVLKTDKRDLGTIFNNKKDFKGPLGTTD